MSTIGIESNAVERGIDEWRRIGERMATLSVDIAEYDLGGVPSSVTGAARSFLTSWSQVAGESADIAVGFADALQATLDDHRTQDEGAAGEFSDLDGSVRP